MNQLSHLRARSIVDAWSELVRMLVTSRLSKFSPMTLSKLYTGQIFALHVIQQRIFALTCSIRTFPKLLSHSGNNVVVKMSILLLDHGEMDAHTKNLNDKNATPMNVSNTSTPPMAVVDPQGPVDCTFLMDECNDGQHFHAKIVKCTCNHDATVGNCDS